MPLQEGQNLGPYQVTARLGQGGMAAIYQAYHARLDRYVAVKMMHPSFLQDPDFHARFEREARIVARLEHPHIVPVYDFDEYEGQPYLVMKYVEGQTLKALLNSGALPLDRIFEIMNPVADALDYAHRQGVLHRDIKPSNIILDSSDTPFLTDFGLARVASAGESTMSQDMLLGTPQYISPEQAMGRREIDARSDVYSFGVILYELVVGRVPFNADTPYAVIHDHIYSELPAPRTINPEIPVEVERVLQKALAKSPDDRYDSASALMTDFQTAVAQSGLRSLNPARAEVADESLARQRAGARPPQPVIAAPIPPAPPVPPTPPTPPMWSWKPPMNWESRVESLAEDAVDAFENAVTEVHKEDLYLMPENQSLRLRIEKQFKKRNEFIGHLVAFVAVNLGLIIFGAFMSTRPGDGIMAFPWPLIVLFGWGSGLAAHAIETYFATGRRADNRFHAVETALANEYGVDYRSRIGRKEVKVVRRRVEKPVKEREDFLSHAAVFVCINIMLLIIWLTSGISDGDLSFPWPLIVLLGWGMGLVGHGAKAYGEGRHMRAIEREIERRTGESFAEKPKRDRGLRLTEDGELTDSAVAQWEADEKPKRGARR